MPRMIVLTAWLVGFCSAAAFAVHPLRWTGYYRCDSEQGFRISTDVQGRVVYLRWLNTPYVLNDRGSTDSTFDWQGGVFRWQGSPDDSTLFRQGKAIATHCRKGAGASGTHEVETGEKKSAL